MLTAEKKDRILKNIRLFAEGIQAGERKELLENAIHDIIDELEGVDFSKPSNADLHRVILEMREGFKRMDQRFEDLIHQMDKRFEAVDKRLADLIHQMDKRFEAVDKRFEAVDKRFEAVDKRFDSLIHHFDKRLDAVDKRFSALQWTIMLAMALLTFVITFFSYIRPPIGPEALEKALSTALEKTQKR